MIISKYVTFEQLIYLCLFLSCLLRDINLLLKVLLNSMLFLQSYFSITLIKGIYFALTLIYSSTNLRNEKGPEIKEKNMLIIGLSVCFIMD